jgi:SAM-dependent methyltransferase
VGDPLRLSFGSVAETYHRTRPAYPPALLDPALDELALPSSARVLELAAGTGTLTAELTRRFARVVAVEPDPRMRAVHGAAIDGSAEAIPLDDESVDAVFVGEAFHWFDARTAIAEIARVLRPRGGLVIVWRHWWETEPSLPDDALALLSEPYQRVLKERNPPWDPAFEGSPFEPLRRVRTEEALELDAGALLELYSTTSSLASLGDEERAALFASVRPLLGDRYRLPIQNELTWTRLAAQ